MAKISQIASKYIIQSTISIEGIVDRPDVIGAIFGQTEGLLGNELELRELQRSGRIGRIEVTVATKNGKTTGEIIIPSSLDKTETAIIGAALEIIQRIGPCNAKVSVKKIEDVRTSKRQFVINRAKELLKTLTQDTLPDSQEIADEVSKSVRMMEVVDYGREKLAAGPAIEDSEEIIVVEGRADVLNLLKHGFKNVIAINGTSCPQTIKELSKRKTTTLFVDGDRGGDLIIRELISTAEIDFTCKAPDGKEVEEITKKEIHKALRGKITSEQAKLDLGVDDSGALKEKKVVAPKRFQERRKTVPPRRVPETRGRFTPRQSNGTATRRPRNAALTASEKVVLKQTMENLFGTRGACVFDPKMAVLGKVPLSEVTSTIKSLNGGVYALALDGEVNEDLTRTAERLGVVHIVGTSAKVKNAGLNVITDDQL
ncbi:DNA primase [Candidatus Woesearchaeota archaeon]|jgi:DNA primase|nr:DNA primase [Candidatus Woesearchaeota archaeon]MBT5740152.1 DNA primase [Candidatus Woesearchaeota archaeon]MBT6402414.1 DNA primase [Candidatus Woesearchaeota archaeon]